MNATGPGKIAKTLSANDIGLTGGHQAGILIPKTGGVLPFFPALDSRQKNPRTVLHVVAPEIGPQVFELTFIHYNNRIVESGTRDEFRLTGMTSLLRSLHPEVGDVLVLRRAPEGPLEANLERIHDRSSANAVPDSGSRSEAGTGWFIYEIE